MDHCICSEEQTVFPENSLEVFAAVRRSCPVLSEIFVDDQLWPRFEAWHRNGDTAARHRSILLLAMERGHLRQVTSPIHLIRAKGEITPQYQKDLRECWMLHDDPIKRNERCRTFNGRLIELKFAEWLELGEGWTISDLEAFGGDADIEACSTGGHRAAFEVKFIGSERHDFDLMLQSLGGRPNGGCVSPYEAIDYLLLRVYEATKQLKVSYDRVVSVIVEEMTWFRVEIQLTDNWIDWEHPKFFSVEFCKGVLGERKLEKYSDFPNDLQATLESLSAVRIFRLSEKFQFHEAEVGFDRREHVGP